MLSWWGWLKLLTLSAWYDVSGYLRSKLPGHHLQSETEKGKSHNMHKHEAKPAAVPAPAPAPALDPKSLMGNAQRTVQNSGKSSAVLLNLTEAFTRVPLPTDIPYPYPNSALQLDPAKVAANEQAEFDYKGPFTCVFNYHVSNKGAEPDDDTLKAIAYDEGVSFIYNGKSYFNADGGGKWSPQNP